MAYEFVFKQGDDSFFGLRRYLNFAIDFWDKILTLSLEPVLKILKLLELLLSLNQKEVVFIAFFEDLILERHASPNLFGFVEAVNVELNL